MPPTTTQKTQLAQFTSITGLREKDALRILKANGWKVDQACDSFFASNGSNAPGLKEKDALTKLFDTYQVTTDEKDSISIDGTMKYLTDIGINLENAEILVPLEIVQAPALGEITREGFVNGWRMTGADTLAKQRSFVADQIAQLATNPILFKRVYKHTFICSKDKGQKALPLENACVYWELLFTSPGPTWATPTRNWTNLWLEFLKQKWTKSVNKDMWNQTLEFYQKTMQDESLSFWSEDGAWPGVIDEFVAYAKERNGSGMETD